MALKLAASERSLGRAARRHAPVEVLVLGDARRDRAQPPQRAQHEVGREPRAGAGHQQRDEAEREQAMVERAPGGARARPGR